MKTLVLLSVLACMAAGVPVQQGKGSDNLDTLSKAHSSLLHHVKREKKSSDQLPNSPPVIHIVPTPELQTGEEALTHTGRNTVNKPLTVKKKFGYRFFRSSEEEKANAESHEACGRPVKIKLCDEDGNIKDMSKSSAHESSPVHSMEDDVKESINKAQQAVENLQRDLKKMEKDHAAVNEFSDSKYEQDLQDDAEVARKMLLHLEEHFSNVTKQHSTASTKSEDMRNEHSMTTHSDEERMAQWKEAINNIQKNVEIATNIEDSFRTAGHPESPILLDQSQSTKGEQIFENNSALHAALNKDQLMRDAQNMKFQTQSIHTDDHKRSLPEPKAMEHGDDSHARKGPHAEDDMKPSASENIEMKSVMLDANQPLMVENQKHHEHGKSAMKDVIDFHKTAANSIDKHDQLEKNSITELSAAESKVSQNIRDIPKALPSDTKKLFHSNMLTEHQRNTELEEPKDKMKQQLKQEMIENKSPHGKSAEHMINSNRKEKTLNYHMVRNAHEFPTALHEFSGNRNEQKDTNVLKSAEEIAPLKLSNILKQNHNFMKAVNNADQREFNHLQTEDSKAVQEIILAETKSAEDALQNAKFHSNDEEHKKVMKSADHVHKDNRNNKNMNNDNTEHKELLTKTKSSEEEFDSKNIFKSVEQNIDYNDTEHQAMSTNMKSADEDIHLTNLLNIVEQNENFMKAANHAFLNSDHKQVLTKMKSAEEHPQLNKVQKTNEANQMFMRAIVQADQESKIPQHVNSESNHRSMLTSMKSTEEPWRHHLTLKSPEEHMHHHSHHHSHHSDHMHDSHWAHENRHFASMKAAEDFKKEFVGHDQRKPLQLSENLHMPSEMMGMNDMDVPNHVHGNAQASARQHQNMIASPNRLMNAMSGGGNMHPNFHATMRESIEGLESGHTFRWQPSNELPRNAYGSSSSGSSSPSGGAVGVFPNANTGGCGIPLLLSCSPSVVSGSLAKPHPVAPPSYSAPSYRAEDEFGFHNKRDVQKSNDGRNANIHRATAMTKQKTGGMLEDKS